MVFVSLSPQRKIPNDATFRPGSNAGAAGDEWRRVGSVTFPAAGSSSYAKPRILLVGTSRFATHLCRWWSTQGTQPRVACEVRVERAGADDAAQTPEDWQRLMLERCVDEVHLEAGVSEGARRLTAAVDDGAKGLGLPVLLYRRNTSHSEPLRGHYVHRHAATYGVHAAAKRVVDVVIATAVLVASLPLLAIIALAIKLTSPGPVFFRQPRVGRGRRQFGMYKFRTMVKNAEELRHAVQSLNHARGISFKVIGDPRVTRVGRWLRRSSLDELPQLINVIRGEMSLVGPRPIPVWVAEQLQEIAYFRRFSVMPGLTGLWQVNGRIQDFDRMADQDLEYVDKWSLALDLKLLARTLPAVLGAEGAN